ncbi:hypothetical protein [Streptomyces sp. NPDC002952]|uniref:hypothetical protein n=1 Tax=Streptomyces sp. NPDC002952 TaxID=3364673 RepID=UPI0036CEA001
MQRSLDEQWPSDVPVTDKRVLVAAGRELLRADATGVGRGAWPSVFDSASALEAPAFSRFRIQAVGVQQAGARRARVHLVWAGADRGGIYQEGRVADFSFMKKGQTWTPLPLR